MPRPAAEAEKTVALAFTLLHGNPPKAVKYKGRLFEFRGEAARRYKFKLQQYVGAEFPGVLDTEYKRVMARNRCLRYIMGIDDEEQRASDS
jgi:hypothetical protein